MALTPGLLLSDRYRLTHRIAVGGMGEVWAADDTRLARSVAVKILKSELTSDPEFVDRFRSEARITASLNHPGIAAVHDYGEVASIAGGPRDTAFLVMELVTGEPLSAVLARTPRLSVPRTLDVLEQSGQALQVAHARSLVHRDIKPGNILITPTGQVKITDFGIAKVAHQVPVTRGGMVMGTAQYLSPEQASGREAGPASDVYALGVVAFECLAGVRPFNAENPVAVAMAQVQDAPPPLPLDVPPPVAGLVMRMLAKDPARRFPDGATLARAVAAVRGGILPAAGGSLTIASGPLIGVVPLPAAAFPSGAAGADPTVAPAGSLPGFGQMDPVTGSVPRPAGVRGPGDRRRTGLAILVALLVLVVAVVTGFIVLRSSDGGPGTPVNSTTPTGPSTSSPVSSTGSESVATAPSTPHSDSSGSSESSAATGTAPFERTASSATGTAVDSGTRGLAPSTAGSAPGGPIVGPPSSSATRSRPGRTVPSVPRISLPPSRGQAAPGTIADPLGPSVGQRWAGQRLTLGAPPDLRQPSRPG